jgi:hypothetical protein
MFGVSFNPVDGLQTPVLGPGRSALVCLISNFVRKGLFWSKGVTFRKIDVASRLFNIFVYLF